MASMGLLDGERLELIDGELLRKMGKNNPHLWTVRLLHKDPRRDREGTKALL
jgi:hypothetical protein